MNRKQNNIQKYMVPISGTLVVITVLTNTIRSSPELQSEIIRILTTWNWMSVTLYGLLGITIMTHVIIGLVWIIDYTSAGFNKKEMMWFK